VIEAKQSQGPPTHQQHELHDTNIDWISDCTYKLFRRKALARRRRQTALAQQLKRQVRQSLQADQQIRFDKVADAAQAHLATNNSRQAYQFLRNCKTRRQDHHTILCRRRVY
jgi:hypothetical protein